MTTAVSVIIPTFNRPVLVRQAIESVLRQRGDFRFEIIVIDDGSTPDTEDALRSFGDAIRYIRQDNAGLNPTRNRGLRLATAGYIALLDDDDVWLPHKTHVLMQALQECPAAGFVHSNFFIWKPDSDARRPDGLGSWFPRQFTCDEMYERRVDFEVTLEGERTLENRIIGAYCGDIYYWSLFAPMVLPSTAIMRRSALQGAQFPEVDSVGDWEFFARLSKRCGCVFVPRETALNRSHEDAFRLTRVDPSLRLQRRIALIRRLWREDLQFMQTRAAEVDSIEAQCLRKLARLGIENGNNDAARQALRALRSVDRDGTSSDTLLWALTYMPFAGAAVGALRSIRQRACSRRTIKNADMPT